MMVPYCVWPYYYVFHDISLNLRGYSRLWLDVIFVHIWQLSPELNIKTEIRGNNFERKLFFLFFSSHLTVSGERVTLFR